MDRRDGEERSDGKAWDLVVIGGNEATSGRLSREAEAVMAAGERLGAAVLLAPHDQVRFVAADRVEVAGKRHTARGFVLCTGSLPRLPDLPGLDETPHVTAAEHFDTTLPSLLVLGAGATGLELASAVQRRGIEVTVVEVAERLLPDRDPECVAELRLRLEAGGLRIHTQVTAESVHKTEVGVRLLGSRAGARLDLDAAALLVCTGRRPNVEGLELAGVDVAADRVRVDAELRTTNPKIFAIGSVAGRGGHDLRHDAELVARNALMPLGARTADRLTPFCIFTTPQLAWVGLTVAEASTELRDVELFESRDAGGLCRLVTASGRLVGAHLVADGAADAIGVATLAIQQRLSPSSLAQLQWPRTSAATLLAHAAQRASKPTWLQRVFATLMV